MIYISHRGNLQGRDIKKENTIDQISLCLDMNLHIEIDLWYEYNVFMLGHDKPQYKIDTDFLLQHKSNLWCHAKNSYALFKLREYNLHYFWHKDDDYTITSNGFIWSYPGSELNHGCIAVMPENVYYSIKNLSIAHGICSDNIEYYQNLLKEKL